MSNGTTATQVSPVIEEHEMSQFQQMFQKISDTIVQASALAKEVSELRAATSELRHDVEYVRSRNKELDQLVSDVREQRDRARSEAEELKHKLATAEAEVEIERSQREINSRRMQDLVDQLTRATKERDDHAFRNLELSEALDKSKEDLRNIEDFAANFLAARKPKATDEPKPLVDPISNVELHNPEPTNPYSGHSSSNPEPVYDSIPYDERKIEERPQYLNDPKPTNW